MLYLASFLTVVFLFILNSVRNESYFITKIDEKFFQYFESIQSKTLDTFYLIVTWLGSLWLLVPAYFILLFFLIKSGYKNILLLSTTFFSAIATTYLVKFLLDRQRPQSIDAITALPSDPSFPSGHTTQISIFVFLLSFLISHYNFENKWFFIGVAGLILLLVASSRIYLYVHYFSDVIAGFIVALTWFCIFIYFVQKGYK